MQHQEPQQRIADELPRLCCIACFNQGVRVSGFVQLSSIVARVFAVPVCVMFQRGAQSVQSGRAGGYSASALSSAYSTRWAKSGSLLRAKIAASTRATCGSSRQPEDAPLSAVPFHRG
jgi:hypothetical protein